MKGCILLFILVGTFKLGLLCLVLGAEGEIDLLFWVGTGLIGFVVVSFLVGLILDH